MDQKTEIRSYIKCRIKLTIDSKQIFNELCGIYGPQTISMRTVFRWVKALMLGNFLLKMILILEGLKPLFVCVVVLRPSQPNGVMSSAVSLPNHTFTGQA